MDDFKRQISLPSMRSGSRDSAGEALRPDSKVHINNTIIICLINIDIDIDIDIIIISSSSSSSSISSSGSSSSISISRCQACRLWAALGWPGFLHSPSPAWVSGPERGKLKL